MQTTSSGYVLSGTAAGKAVRAVVTAGGLEVGRSHTCGLAVADLEASRLHCVVRLEGEGVTVEDRSQNGTFVNGTKISGTATLKIGDTLKIGTTELVLKAADDAVTQVVAPREAAAPAPAQSAPSEPAALKPGDMVDRYRIKRLIGRGGMGAVYEAVHTGLDLPRALKVLTLPDDASYATFRNKFLDEGKILARLRHENITQVHDAAYDEKTRTLFFVMDLVIYDDGKPCTLADVSYDECDVSAWFASLASALDYIHSQGIVHSDIKMQNVLVSSGQKIKLADFGVAHLLAGNMRASLHGNEKGGGREAIGYTEHYVAPEILGKGKFPSAASDVYALGVMLVRLLSGKWYDEHPEVLAEIASKRSLNWRPILVQMLSADPAKRVTDLAKLVQQLRHGSNANARRKYQIESRRRRNQKIRLQRMPGVKTQGLRPTAFAPEPIGPKILRWSAVAGIVLAAIVGVCWMRNVNAEKERVEQARQEAMRVAHEKAEGQLRKTHDALAERAAVIKALIAPHRQEFEFVDGLSQENVSKSTDKATAAARNDLILRYAGVLQKIDGVRTALAACKKACDEHDMHLQNLEGVPAVERAAAEFEADYRAKAEALEAACKAEGREWDSYAETKAANEASRRNRDRFSRARRVMLASVRETLETVPELKTSPELAAAKEKIEEGDRALAGGAAGFDTASNCYTEVIGLLSNGCVRLERQRTERVEIEAAFHRIDDDLRTTMLPKLRHGQEPLSVVASHAKAVSVRFAEKWKQEGMFPVNRDLSEDYALYFSAQALYLEYMVNRLPGTRDGLTYVLTPTGVDVKSGRFTYRLKWSELLSSKKRTLSTEERARREVRDFLNVPAERKAGAKPLIGRWLVLKELMPDANDAEQESRLVEAIQKDGSAAVLACARRVLPEKFPPAAAPEPPPEISLAKIPSDLNRVKPDPQQERLIFFEPLRGLALPAIRLSETVISKCQRVKDTNRVRFQVENGEIKVNGLREGRPFIDIEKGGSFDVYNYEMITTCRFELVAWIDNALGAGKPLVLVRCQSVSEAGE